MNHQVNNRIPRGVGRDRGKWIGLLALAFVAIPSVAAACLAVGAGGAGVRVASETAIIVWDSSTHVEHFIRLANFETDAKDVGFLVPTPTIPTLTEANKYAFSKLLADVRRHQPQPFSLFPQARMAAKAAGPQLSVSHVGGYEATVLSLKDPTAVEKWLADHKFPMTTATSDWLKVYSDKHWVITAYRVEATKGQAGLNPVRMTFHSDVPFYPYREPLSLAKETKPRTLRVFFLSDQPVDAWMGGQHWVGKEEVADQLTEEEKADLTSSLPGITFPEKTWLTSFLDTSAPRLGVDDVLFFKKYVGPYKLVGGLVGAAFGLIIVFRRKRIRARRS